MEDKVASFQYNHFSMLTFSPCTVIITTTTFIKRKYLKEENSKASILPYFYEQKLTIVWNNALSQNQIVDPTILVFATFKDSAPQTFNNNKTNILSNYYVYSIENGSLGEINFLNIFISSLLIAPYNKFN